VGDMNSLLQHVKPTGEPLTFRTENLGRPHDVTLEPLYQLNYQRYTVYWNVVNPVDWKKNAGKTEIRYGLGHFNGRWASGYAPKITL